VSWQAQTWAVEMGKRYELEPGHRWLLNILANYADPEGNDIFPSIATLMADTGFGENTIRRGLKHLMACGLMDYGNQAVVALKVSRADRRPKVYRLLMGDPTGSHGGTPPTSTGSQADISRGAKRGATMAPKPINPKENQAAAADVCRKCDRERPESELSASGICSDCLGIRQHSAAEGAAYREQIRLRRLAASVGTVP
jgi:hypothetical protein